MDGSGLLGLGPLIRQLTSVPGPVSSWPACPISAAGLLDALLDGQSGERLSQTWVSRQDC